MQRYCMYVCKEARSELKLSLAPFLPPFTLSSALSDLTATEVLADGDVTLTAEQSTYGLIM
jgi:hypothetical protein